jgi:Flp pilus assembly protein TadD
MMQSPAAGRPAEPNPAPTAVTIPDEARRAFAGAVDKQRLGDGDGALELYTQAIEACPYLADAYNNIAVLLKSAKRFPAGIACLRRALLYAPQSAALYSNLGNLLWMALDFEAAETAFRRALAMEPDRPEALHNHGLLLNSLGDYPGAIASFDRALARQPDNVLIQWDRALARLTGGDLVRGFAEYEVRLQLKHAPKRSYPIPHWQGEDLSGRTLLVWSEQGLGDTLQFVRYLPILAARGVRIVFHCQPELLRLFGSFPGTTEIGPIGGPLPAADFHAPLLSLPYRLGTTMTTIPAAVPYVAPPTGIPVPQIGRPAGTRLAIGVVWAGNPTHENDHNRSMPIEHFFTLCDIPGVALYSLQKGPRSSDLQAQCARPLVRDLGPLIHDFADAAAILMQLDLLISVDTAAIHLAGALGRPGFLLMPFTPDWRWLNHRADTPWYPTLRLFRQTAPRDWEGVMRRVHGVLSDALNPSR